MIFEAYSTSTQLLNRRFPPKMSRFSLFLFIVNKCEQFRLHKGKALDLLVFLYFWPYPYVGVIANGNQCNLTTVKTARQEVLGLYPILMRVKHMFVVSSMTLLLLFGINGVANAQLTAQDQDQDQALKNGSFNIALYQGAQWRNIGPFRGGRSVAVAGHPADDQIYYMGSTGGGVWRTADAGLHWTNISDGYFNVGSIGAIEVAQSDPNIIYVGTGEHAVRGVMSSSGDGVYKSTDGGKSWMHLGLDQSRHISDIQIHPHNPDIVYVAVQGAAHGPSEDRGIYKSVDGGFSWEQMFYKDEYTGAADLSMDVNNPRILYAAMWDHERKPWQIRSGGPGSGLFKSTDGGESWYELGAGLPQKMGKTSICVSPANSNVVYANIEAEKGGVFRSADGGWNWEQVNDQHLTIARAWYYTEIVADPEDEHTVYVLNAPLLRSNDGGRNFETISVAHFDQHDLWINPKNPANMILANDGGACISFNDGRSWSTQNNQPTAQFYRVITDRRYPNYYIYGGQQDYSAIAIPSRTNGRGIDEKDWYQVAGGESAFIAFDPDDPTLVFGGSYQGNISTYNQETEERKDIMAYPNVGLATLPRDMKYRFNWNAPIVASPQNPNVIYHASQYVLRTRKDGFSWKAISPDLTRNDKSKQGPGGVPFTNEGAGGENYNTISYLACSPHSSLVLWVGTDDGLVHITKDEGFSWTNVTPPDLEECLINSIEVSPHDPATAYVVATRYKFNDFKPSVYRTTDYGANWEKITRGIAPDDFVRVVREDPSSQGLLYAGTETGLYVSYNNGGYWHRFQLNLPVCPINDLAIENGDLIAATSGRGFWVLDELSFLRQSAGYIMSVTTPHLFRPSANVYRVNAQGGGNYAGMGKNPPKGMIIDYYIPPVLDTADFKIEIIDKRGKNRVLRSFSSIKDPNYEEYPGGPKAEPLLPKGFGIHRFNWDLRKDPVEHVDGLFVLGDYKGSLVAPGDYYIRLSIDGEFYEEMVSVSEDPRVEKKYRATDYENQEKFLTELEETITDIHLSVRVMQDLKMQMTALHQQLKRKRGQLETTRKTEHIIELINEWEKNLVQTEQETYQDVINYSNGLNAELINLHDRCDGIDPRITGGARARKADLLAEWNDFKSQLNNIYEAVNDFNDAYARKQLPVLFIPDSEEDRDAW